LKEREESGFAEELASCLSEAEKITEKKSEKSDPTCPKCYLIAESRGKKGPNPCVAYTATATRASDSGLEQVGLMSRPFLHVGAHKGASFLSTRA
jgi:hypothetical protein